jgi:hypothetical protein
VALATFAARGGDIRPALFLNRSDAADYIFDAEPFLALKDEMVRAHRSQVGVLESLVDGSAGSSDELMQAGRLEGYRVWGDEEMRRAALERLRRFGGEGVAPVT